MKYEYLTIEVPPETMASLNRHAKDCRLDVGTWLSEVLEHLDRDAGFSSPEYYRETVDELNDQHRITTSIIPA